MAELRFYTGVMDAGKSTLALQTNHNRAARGLVGRLFTVYDRAGSAKLTSRLGLSMDAIEVREDFDFWASTVDWLTHGAKIDYFVCDEAQFYTRRQVEDLARIVDDLKIDVFCFGILTSFRTELFEGSARLIELADSTEVLQVEALCWCGARATHNARLVDGVMVTEGDVVVVGDMTDSNEDEPGSVTYEVLCRRHHRAGMTADKARAESLIAYPLPLS